ncbi:tRNA (guanine(37)-N(1))-methyltransferase isoform X1 [Paramormyrops kingsleyae]|uniref:tRNA (guanine(37)-N(1))-methyltransferase isoform X1 n=2 Tax=Paramormyrops kingsleyae TaxID=1676925 RepID=UPI003B97794A
MWRFIYRCLKNVSAPSLVTLRPLPRSPFCGVPRSALANFAPTHLLMVEQKSVEILDLYGPPPEVRGMTCLDREAFGHTVKVPTLRIQKDVLHKAVKNLKRVALKRPGLKRVLEVAGDESHKVLLLDPASVSSPTSFSEAEKRTLGDLGVPLQIGHHELRITYENLKADEVLRAVLPEGQDVTSGFSRVGHIAHLNLREHQLPYRKLIGQVLIDKNSGVTCVVNKTNTIDSTFRNFQMEVLAGDGNMVTKVRENGVSYEFDFSQVYWNPRLSTEHERVVDLLRPGDVVLDVFAGVGPFAIPAARRGCSVLANDLNPESHRWLLHNCRLNKVDGKVRTFNMDGRAFIRGPLREALPSLLQGPAEVHVVMNLPALALEFLDAFHGLLDSDSEPELVARALPQVHCYGFSKQDDPRQDVVDRASASLGVRMEGRCSVHMVRNVAPNKEMMCISFHLPREVLFSNHSVDKDSPEEPSSKRQKCGEPTD